MTVNLPVRVIDIRTLGEQTLACEACGEVAEPDRLLTFLTFHVPHKSLVLMREDERGDLYVAGELAPLKS